MSRKSKYSAVPTEVDGIRFHSKKEAKRYWELKMLERAGEISDLELQPSFCLNAAGQGYSIGIYKADFSYVDRKQNRIVEDVKGFKTPLYKWKKKHVEAQYGIQIQEL